MVVLGTFYSFSYAVAVNSVSYLSIPESLGDVVPSVQAPVGHILKSLNTLKVTEVVEEPKNDTPKTVSVFDVPFFSQFEDISAVKWQKIGCGIASLAMLVEYYEPGEVSVDTLLNEGIASGAYLKDAGWIHRDLALLADDHGLEGMNYDLSSANMDTAFAQFETAVEEGPVIASVHYTFDPQNPIPHLVVISGIDGDVVYYNDPAGKSEGGNLSVGAFKRAWKKRYIEVRPII
ncbi:hypothetical protein A2442_00435 [Candidatus Campbellbacteria bacterium RIFOXYC2_FULL_35_25]|uniref:Peptidase C39 domain-containing protein n=1 Tax=Candidatus Campbellbacteria bacterium RIFOXYC2_FULL_35_25 TaxID=1797582 RepID=A0A1F5EI46_9BACT|nr:MAG: hypothetical protein A2442_00435 [Candidatus Campbellbacteria bacterium RIFOXYC2_FULL_35_25]